VIFLPYFTPSGAQKAKLNDIATREWVGPQVLKNAVKKTLPEGILK
jgi:hypothetical protein